MEKNNVAIIGAGPMGLMCAYELLKKGFKVTLFESDDRIGGMSASFDFMGTQVERFYHFICATDFALFELLKELNLSDHLRWHNTKMGFYYQGKLYPWGDPISLMKFPHLSLVEKLRYGTFIKYACGIKDWQPFDKLYAKDWVSKWIGNNAYGVLWESLFKYKFYQYKDNLSAAWLGTRIQRVGKSRKSLFQESLGYLEGGSDSLLKKMEQAIIALGGSIVLNAKVTKLEANEQNQVSGVVANNQFHPFDVAISTVPLPYTAEFAPDLPNETRQQIINIKNVGVRCILFKLKQSFSPYFWLNVNDPRMEIPGVIEYTNLNDKEEKILYVPYYMPQEHPKYGWDDQQFIMEVTRYLQTIKPDFNEKDILATHVARYGFAQTVCTPNFYAQLPPMKSSITNFYMADTSYYYPEDRSISESVKVGSELARLVYEN